ncbi:MAG TPA: SRPBCC domain-containing protein [Chitinophagaceae bacterium]|nr:SRPBCC domain-containing protein [Chitinophagaceae bacterium]
MNNQPLEIKATIQVAKPANEVFEAIVDPAKMSNYFIAQSTGRMEEGKQLTWKFPEFDMEVPVRINRIDKDKHVSFYWEGAKDHDCLVEMTLTQATIGQGTVVQVTEKGLNNDEAGIKWLKSNTEGWANFLACMKAYLEYGINLRKGAFDYMKK